MAYHGNAPADVALVVGQDVITTTEIQDATIATADIASDAITATKVDDDGTGFQMGSLGLGTAVSGSHKLTVGGTATFSGDITGTLATASQPNITSVSTLTSLTTSGDLLVSSSDPTITIKRSNSSSYAGHLDFTNNADALGWQVGTNQVTGDGFEVNYGASNKFYLTTGGNATFTGTISSSISTGSAGLTLANSTDATGIWIDNNSNNLTSALLNMHGYNSTSMANFKFLYCYDSNASTMKAQILGDGSATFALDGTFGGRLYTTDGSASYPAYSFSSNSTTGMYLGTTNTLRFATGGAERVEITSAQTKVTGDFITTGGIQSKGTNGNNPTGDWYDVKQKFLTYKHDVTSTHVNDGYFSVSHGISRGNILGVIPHHYGYGGTNVNNFGITSGFVENVIMYANATLRVYIGSSVVASDKIYLTMIVEGNTG